MVEINKLVITLVILAADRRVEYAAKIIQISCLTREKQMLARQKHVHATAISMIIGQFITHSVNNVSFKTHPKHKQRVRSSWVTRIAAITFNVTANYQTIFHKRIDECQSTAMLIREKVPHIIPLFKGDYLNLMLV